jgi:hypothetical protein
MSKRIVARYIESGSPGAAVAQGLTAACLGRLRASASRQCFAKYALTAVGDVPAAFTASRS